MLIACFIGIALGERVREAISERSYVHCLPSEFNSSGGVQATKQTQRPRRHCQQVVSYAPAGTDGQTVRTGRRADAYVPQRQLQAVHKFNFFGAPKSMQYECEAKGAKLAWFVCVRACVCVVCDTMAFRIHNLSNLLFKHIANRLYAWHAPSNRANMLIDFCQGLWLLCVCERASECVCVYAFVL